MIVLYLEKRSLLDVLRCQNHGRREQEKAGVLNYFFAGGKLCPREPFLMKAVTMLAMPPQTTSEGFFIA
ncbi:MAG: hypothetical protein J5846_09195 [Desulfovibrio sp.]|nr:hypothetical protein [Desulfovibrio sp.]